MQNAPVGMGKFPPSNRHAYMDADAVKRLVRSVKAGLEHTANLERKGDGWRLRVKFVMPDGSSVRRAITLPDAETAEWVGGYIERARLEAAKRRSRLKNRSPSKREPAKGEQP